LPVEALALPLRALPVVVPAHRVRELWHGETHQQGSCAMAGRAAGSDGL
jgi:hypothetical protein